MDDTLSLARRSRCKRLQVAATIVSPDYRYVLARGYNGGAAGDDAPEGECSGVEGACGCLHAEDNAVVNCNAPRSAAKLVFITHAPCAQCAKRLVNLGGVQRVVFNELYRSDAGVVLLRRLGVRVASVEELQRLESEVTA